MSTINTFTRIVSPLVVLAIGLAGAAYILRPTAPGGGAGGHRHDGAGHDHGDHDDDSEKGPHNGRLLTDGDFAVEITIYERGVPPRFRIYTYQTGQPVEPNEVTLSIRLSRLGGRVDDFAFAAESDYLTSERIVEEPHSFDVEVTATHRDQTHGWTYATYEGRVTLTPRMA